MAAWLWRLLGKDPDACVIHFASGPEDHVRATYAEIVALEPVRRHFVVCLCKPIEGLPCLVLPEPSIKALAQALGPKRIGLAPFQLHGEPAALRRLAYRAAPAKLLSYNARGERHHLKLSTPLASLLFLGGVELDRIWLRPAWWPWARERTRPSAASQTLAGRPLTGKPRVAILSPYFPWPLSHGGAVRIYSMLREASKEFDLFLYCFSELDAAANSQPVLDLVHQAVLFEMPRYREPRWSSLEPPEVREFYSAALQQRLQTDRAKFQFRLVQSEYTQFATYAPDVLVEHDVTFDLYRQVYRNNRSLAAWWDWWRWRHFELHAANRIRRVVVMADKDAEWLPNARVTILPNGVDLARFTPTTEPTGQRLLFIGSFRHFPNVFAFRFLYEQIWPIVQREFPQAELEVVAGPDHLRYWPDAPPSGHGLTMHGFVADVVPLYRRANLVLSTTLVSAGTNLKVLEAMAMERAIVSTPSGCAGLGLQHGTSAFIHAEAAELAQGIQQLLNNPAERRQLAQAARRIALDQFDWHAIGRKQAALWQELIG